MVTTIPRLLACLVVAIAAASPAHAGLLGKLVGGAASAAASGKEKKTYDASTLRPPELKACLIEAHDVDVAADEIGRDKTALETQREDLQKNAKALKAKGEKDKAVVAYRAKEKEFNGKVELANEKIGKLRAKNDHFHTACAGKRYFSSDLAAVTPELPPEVRAQVAAKK